MLNIVIPMAGRGSRFADAGYELPKPLIEIHGQPMIRYVINNLRPTQPHRFIFLCLSEHIRKYGIDNLLREWSPTCEVVTVDSVTQGAACTVLLAKRFIDSNEGLMIANSDQWVNVNIDKYLQMIDVMQLDGLIMTMRADDPKWSFVRIGETNMVTEVVEKRVISKEATVGIYNFKMGKDFVKAAEEMIKKDLRTNGEFYVAPVYNELITSGKVVGYYNIGHDGGSMHGLGIPADLEAFSSLQLSMQIAKKNLL